MVTGQRIDESLNEVLHESDLQSFRRQICFDLQLTKLDHFEHVKDRDLQNVGISLPAIRRLRAAIVDKKKHLRRHPERAVRTVLLPEDDVPVAREAQAGTSSITKDQVKLMENLGEGTFAVVKRALWNAPDGRRIDVAVKILRDASPLVMEELQREVDSLQKLQHVNLIRLYGVVADATWMIFELCEGGSLLDRLRDRKKPPLLVSTMLDYCQQIAKGMSYLEVKHCVHRDLATRNVLLSSDEKTVKICDFGLMRTLEENERLYIMNPQKRVPFAWCPPESLRFRQFSHASDVWAMGVLMWEIFSFGEDPWVGLKGRDVLERIDAGERLAKPRFCSQQVYDLMDLCWKANPDARPKFKMFWGLLKQATFNVAEVREAHPAAQDERLELHVGDRVQVIDNVGVLWFGQNERSRCFGTFLRSAVFVRTASESRPEGSGRISRPIVGSFIHTGHGDVREGKSWGKPDEIDKIYLSNPVLGKPHDRGVPTIVDTILPQTKVKPQLPSKPPALNVSKQSTNGGTSFSPHRDPFEDALALNRAANELAPTRTLFPIATPSTRPVQNEPAAKPVRAAPAPPSHQRSHAYLGSHAVPRPQGNRQQEPGTSRSANSTPPTVKADQFLSAREVANRLEGQIMLPSTPNIGISLAPVKTGVPPTAQKQSAPPAVGHGHSVLSELQKRLVSNGNETVRLRPQALQETPVYVHSQMSTLKGPASHQTNYAGFDPFEVSSAIKNIVTKDRYSEVLERRGTQLQPQQPSMFSSSSSVLRPQSSSTPQLGSIQVLTPTPAPSSARMTSSPVPVQVTQIGLQQTAQSRSSVVLPQPATVAFQQRPMSQVLIPTPAPTPQPLPKSTSSGVPNSTQSRMSMQALRSTASTSICQSALPSHSQQLVAQQAGQTRLVQPSQVALPPVNALKSQTAHSQSAGQLNTATTAAATRATSTTCISSTATMTTAANGPVLGSTPTSSTNVPHTVARKEVDVSSLLPPPSALFYGGNVPVSSNAAQSSASADLSKRPSTTAATTTANTSALQVRTAQVMSSSTTRASTSNAATTTRPNPAPVVLPSQALVPTPLYPTIASISSPALQLSASAHNTQNAATAPDTVAFRPQSVSSMPLFSAQQSLGGYSGGYGGVYGGGYSGGYGGGYGGGLGGGYGYGSQYGIPSAAHGGYSMTGVSQVYAPMYPNLAPQISAPRVPLLLPEPRPVSNIIHSTDVISSFDPLAEMNTPRQSIPAAMPTTPPPASTSSGVSRAEQMEILYTEASFTDRGKCDKMVGVCGGNVEEALQKLKIEHLVETGIASDRAIAMSALEARAWNLNAAAEAIISG